MAYLFISPLLPKLTHRLNGRTRTSCKPKILVSAKSEKGLPNRLPSGKGDSSARSEGKVGFVGSDTIGISFTCNANSCNQRITKTIKRKSYEKGTVLIQCPSCNKHHVIADNMGMYAHLTGGRKNVEEIARDAGVNVTRVSSATFDLEKLVSTVIDGDNINENGTFRESENPGPRDQEPTEENN